MKSGIEFRAATPSELDAVYTLTHNIYVREGYAWPCWDRRLVHYPHLDGIPQTTVLVALADGRVVGTNSWTRDGPQGLHVDDDFRAEANLVRREGRFLASSWRIVVDQAYQFNRKVIIGLIRKTVTDMVQANIETSLFTFNPKHETVYRKLLHMRTIGYREAIHALRAPAVLMRLDWEQIPDHFLP